MKYSLKVVFPDRTFPTKVVEGTLQEVINKAQEVDSENEDKAIAYYIEKKTD